MSVTKDNAKIHSAVHSISSPNIEWIEHENDAYRFDKSLGIGGVNKKHCVSASIVAIHNNRRLSYTLDGDRRILIKLFPLASHDWRHHFPTPNETINPNKKIFSSPNKTGVLKVQGMFSHYRLSDSKIFFIHVRAVWLFCRKHSTTDNIKSYRNWWLPSSTRAHACAHTFCSHMSIRETPIK